MKKMLFSLFLMALSACDGEKFLPASVEKLTIQFIPFLNPDDCTVELIIGKDSAEMNYKVYTPPNPTTGQQRGSEGFDSLTVKIGGPAYIKFAERVRGIDFSRDLCNRDSLASGFLYPSSVKIEYINKNSDTTACDYSEPPRNHCHPLFRLLDAFFELADSVMPDRKHVEYRETLKNRYDFSFRMKKLNGLPLEYGFFGYYQNKDRQRLLRFMDSLPSNQPVIIDVDKAFTDWREQIDPAFRDKLKDKKHIYWLDTDKESESNFLRRLGIGREPYKNRKGILKEIYKK